MISNDELLNDKDFQRLMKTFENEGLSFKFESDEKNPDIIGYAYTSDNKKKYVICTKFPISPEPPIWDEKEQMRKLDEYIDKLDQDYCKPISSFDERPFYHRFDNNRPKKRK